MLSDQITAKRGPLARVWLASHWERKISKSQFLQTNLEKTIDAITTNQQEPLALRISGQLLLGVVRIYSRKTRYLLEDCNEALVRIKLAFKKGDVNMPDISHSIANQSTITLPERLTEFDIMLPDAPFNMTHLEMADPMLDNLALAAISQDISFSEESSWGYEETEQGRRLAGTDADDLMGTEGFTFGDIEQGRRDTGPELVDQAFTMDDIDEPLNKMRIDDTNDVLDFDFDFEDTAEARDEHAANQPERAVEFDTNLNTLMQSGIMPDTAAMDLSTQQLDFVLPDEHATVQEPTRRRRKLVVDKVTEIPHTDLRRNISDTSAITDRTADTRSSAMATKGKQLDISKPLGYAPGSGLTTLFDTLGTKRRGSAVNHGSPKEARLTEPLEDMAGPSTAGIPTAFDGQELGFDDFATNETDFDFGINTAVDEQGAGPSTLLENEETSFFSQNGQSTQLNQSAHQTLTTLTEKFDAGANRAAFGDLVPGTASKAEAARKFYDVLLLSTKNMIQLKQQQSYGEIEIRPVTMVA
ncbi:Rec8 like protein-domain-containing protein [Radiomyces spectabilis]|uniref:Rec8 like protein-domain-containing protein n=1 Tax=Radiomyces spectabilis TaxID=64574 RepID=UPI0022208D92|nr:Rec8 like protein-domain-containing protein [Radiomyces spectabilis]KAI8371434.1 Rec8 like protein-domain-containing protein [Radiomyces spectabilis]